MKLIIQIPALNEADTLPAVIRDLPRSIPGIREIEYLVIDDGSTDGTSEVARQLGVHHVLRFETNLGLAKAFEAGIRRATELGMDILVNTDGDHQYRGRDIPQLIKPILEKRADMVVGCRPILDHPEFGPLKKALQVIGSSTLRWVSKTDIRDAASGFRAYSRETCQRLFIHSTFSYCMETLIQAGNSGLRVSCVDVGVNPMTRPSRLFRNIGQYVYRSGLTILSMFVLYRPGRFFFTVAMAFESAALVLGLRYFYLVFLTTPDPTRTYLPSLILLAMLALTGTLLFFVGILAEVIKAHRNLTQEVLYLLRKTETERDTVKSSRVDKSPATEVPRPGITGNTPEILWS